MSRVATAWLLPLLFVTTFLLAHATARSFLDVRRTGNASVIRHDRDAAGHRGGGANGTVDRAPYGDVCGKDSGEANGGCATEATPVTASAPSGDVCTSAPSPADGDCGSITQAQVDSLEPAGESRAKDHLRELNHRIEPGQTITEVLDWAGVSQQQIHEWVRATNKVYNLNRIYVGQEVSLLVDTRSSTLEHLALDIDQRSRLIAEREDLSVVARRQEIEHDRRTVVRGGTIERTLYSAAVAAHVPDRIVADMADVLGWELNLATDLRRGATFRVVYEELARTDSSSAPIPGHLLAAEIKNRGRTYEVFRFAPADGSRVAYYTRSGEALGRAFLRYPVSFNRISSHFSKSRFHPVLKRRRPHYGVDLAARRGTPVKAIGDGKIRKAGWYGGYGRFVRIRHDGVYESGYAHLSRIARGIRPGASVRKGQVIGYVGSTGRATGPHLHFEMYRRGRYINPLTANLPRIRSLSGESLTAFRSTIEYIDRTYAEASAGTERLAQLTPAALHQQPAAGVR